MVAKQLSLWGAMPQASAPSETPDLGVCPRGVNESTIFVDPCKACPLRGLCAPDECGFLLHPIDVDKPEEMDFEEWLSEPWDY